MTAEQNKSFNSRLIAFKIFLCLFVALVILRLFIIAVSDHGYYQALADNQHNFFQQFAANRGEIFVTDKYSKNAYPVATNAQKNLVYVVPGEIKDYAAATQKLSGILSIDQPTLLAKISDKQKNYIALVHDITDQQSSQITAAKIAGVYLSPEAVRFYPEGNFLSQVLGFTGYSDNSPNIKIGLYGLEKYFQKTLAGTDGQVATEADLNGNWIAGANRNFLAAQDGSSLTLTIDRSIQYQAEKVLSAAVQKHGADSGSVIVANPKTGAILAIANYPSFDPNNYGQTKDLSNFIDAATTENYEPGSTMKAVTLGGALDQGLITPQTTFQDSGEVDIAGYKIQNSDHKVHGLTTMTEVLDHSLNTGAIWVEQQLGNDKFSSYLKKFGFGHATNVELPEAAGDISNVSKSNDPQINFYTAAFGQGITVTPIQMIQAYDPLANKGQMMQPYLVDSITSADGKTVTKISPKIETQVISQSAATLMTAMLVDDVENGYGKAAGVKGYYIAGKTGTAQVAGNGGYVANDNIGSFVGYGPAQDPQFLMLVNINHPRDVNFAETTAAPAFGEIANFILNYYQIKPTR